VSTTPGGQGAAGGPQLRKVVALALLLVLVGLIVASDTLHAELASLVALAEAVIRRAPVTGMAVFVGLSALSAMIAFFSSGLLTPVAIASWGTVTTLGLLWLGWLLGGIATYAVGRYVGRSAAGLFVDDATLATWEATVATRATVSHVALLQLALPSEVLGYVLGLVRYSFRIYVGVLAVTEIPYALAVVFLGESFLAGDARMFVLVGAAALATTAVLMMVVRRRLA